MIYTITFIDKKTKLGWRHTIDTSHVYKDGSTKGLSEHIKKCLAQSGWGNVKVSRIQEVDYKKAIND